MKLVIERNKFLNEVQRVIGAANGKNSLPVLNYLHLVGDGEFIRMTATDLETTLQTTFAHADEPFEALLPAKRLYDVLRAFPEQMVGLQDKDGKIIVKCGKSRFQLTTLPVTDYPMMDDLVWDGSFTMGQAELRSMILYTEHAMASKDVRYYLNGTMFDLNPNGDHTFTMVTTDGHRLAKTSIPALDLGDVAPHQVIVPLKAMGELKKLLKDEGDCTIHFSSNRVKVQFEGFTFVAKLIDGKFPDYARVIPRGSEMDIRVKREDFLDAIRRVGLVLNDKTTGVAVQLTDNLLTLKGRNNDQEESEEQIEVKVDIGEGKLYEIGFNHQYLFDVAKAMQSEYIMLHFQDAASSLMIDSEQMDEGTFVVMPMRL